MKEYSVKVQAWKSSFFKELMDSLDFVTCEEVLNSSDQAMEQKSTSPIDVKYKSPTEDKEDEMSSIRDVISRIDRMRDRT